VITTNKLCLDWKSRASTINAQRKGHLIFFAMKMEQAAEMLKEIHDHFQKPLLVVTDSWFGNDCLLSRLKIGSSG